MRTIRMTTGSLVLLALAAGLLASGALAGTAGAAEPSSLLRCEANFVGFIVGSSNEAIHSGCEDLAPAYEAGVAAYQARDATCDAISRVAHPIKRTECEAGAKKDGLDAFRTLAKAIREGAAPAAAVPTAPATTPTTSEGIVGRVTTLIKDHPVASLGVGLGAATLAIPATRGAALAVGGLMTGVLGQLWNLVKAPFTAAAKVFS